MGMAPPINIKTNEEANLYKFLEKPSGHFDLNSVVRFDARRPNITDLYEQLHDADGQRKRKKAFCDFNSNSIGEISWPRHY